MDIRPRIIAVDFDGCLCENAWSDIGAPRQAVIDALLERKKDGAKIILWTCRVEERLVAAVKWCAEHGIIFDAVNANLPSNIAAFGNDCRKIYADEYWDDKAVTMNQPCDALPVKGTISIKHPWFSATLAVLKHFTECVEHEKRTRIVIDYDPQSENTAINYYSDLEG